MEWPVIEILELLVKFVVIVASTVVTYYVRKYNLERWVVAAVKAAEMVYNESGMGEKKYQYVVNYMRSNYKWFTFTDEQLRVLIEAAVKELNKNK